MSPVCRATSLCYASGRSVPFLQTVDARLLRETGPDLHYAYRTISDRRKCNLARQFKMHSLLSNTDAFVMARRFCHRRTDVMTPALRALLVFLLLSIGFSPTGAVASVPAGE